MTDTCPKCLANLQGEPIPPEDRQYYPPAVTHFDRIISIYDRGLDRTVAWRCPDCGFQCASRSYFTPASPPPEQ